MVLDNEVGDPFSPGDCAVSCACCCGCCGCCCRDCTTDLGEVVPATMAALVSFTLFLVAVALLEWKVEAGVDLVRVDNDDGDDDDGTHVGPAVGALVVIPIVVAVAVVATAGVCAIPFRFIGPGLWNSIMVGETPTVLSVPFVGAGGIEGTFPLSAELSLSCRTAIMLVQTVTVPVILRLITLLLLLLLLLYSFFYCLLRE